MNQGGTTAPPPVSSRPAVPLTLTTEDGGGPTAAAPAPASAAHSSRPALPATLLGTTTPTVSMPAQPGHGGSGGLSGSTALADAVSPGQAEQAPPGGLSAAYQAAEELHVPPFGMFPSEKSKYYPGQMVDPVSGTHYDSENGMPTHVHTNGNGRSRPQDIVLHWDDAAAPARANRDLVIRFLAAFGGILVVAGLVAHLLPEIYAIPLVLAQFLGALLLPVMRVVPWADEDADDVFLFLLLTLAGGPLVALVVYGVISALRQNTNPAILGCLSIALVARLVIGSAAGGFAWGALNPFAQVGKFDWHLLLVNWSGLAALAGWYAASVFHKLDE
jgi:hypothetical protein